MSEPAPTPPPRRRIRAILNRGGRALALGGPEAVAARVAGALRAAGADPDVRLVGGAGLTAAVEAAREDALAGRIDAVLVGGGDGSAGSAAGVLAGTGVAYAPLPLGTLNHFSKDLGLPEDLEEAAAAIAGTARPRRVDVAEVDGLVFVNNALIGVYPYMVADRERRRREGRIGKWAAMALASLRMLARFPRRRLVVRTADRKLRYRTPCLIVGVNEYHPGRMELRREGGLDGGLLWVLIAKHRTPWGFAWFALRSVLRGLDEGRDFDVLRATEVVIKTKSSRVPVAHDGEVRMMRGKLRFKLRPGALLVLAPAPPAGQPDPSRGPGNLAPARASPGRPSGGTP